MKPNPRLATRLLHCRVAEQTYCFDARQVANVLQGAAVKRKHKAELVEWPGLDPSLIVGQVQSKRQTVPVVRACELFANGGGERPRPSRREHLVIAETGQGRLGVLVDLVYRASHVARDFLVAMPRLAHNDAQPFFRGLVRLDDRIAPEPETDLLAQWNLEPSVGAVVDRRRTGIARRAALLICPDGLVHCDSRSTPLPTPNLDLSGMTRHATHYGQQLMLFDFPQVTTEGKRTALAISVTQVVEVMRAEPLLPVPHGPDRLIGLALWRNYFVPVLDLPQQLGLGECRPESRKRIVIARTIDHQLLGFFSGAEIRTLRLPIDAERRPAKSPEEAGMKGLTRGRFETPDAQLILPHLEALAT